MTHQRATTTVPCLCHLGGLRCRLHVLHETVDLKVRRNAHSPADARLLLEALGIVAPGGTEILPDPPPATLRTEDVKVPTPPDPWSSPRAQAAARVRPVGCTTPPGLRDLPERNAS